MRRKDGTECILGSLIRLFARYWLLTYFKLALAAFHLESQMFAVKFFVRIDIILSKLMHSKLLATNF